MNNDAKLVDANNNPLYQLVITSPNQGLRNAANLTGSPDGAAPPGPPYAVQPYTPTGAYNSAATGGQVLAVVNNWGGVQNVTPVGTAPSSNAAANSNTGFLVIGPQNPPLAQNQAAGQQTQIVTSVTANNMAYTVPNADVSADNPVAPTILLQRLANPNAAFNAVTNPFVTVDYVDMQQVQTAVGGKVVNDARPFNAAGANATNFIASPNARFSYGRNQPYGAVETAAAWQKQVAPASPPAPAQTANQPTTTFFNVNTPKNPAVPPDWLVHLDRPLISPMELLNVSGFKPHELTQQFYKDNTGAFQHLAPWTNQSFLLYRLLEFVKVKNATPGIAEGGRVPGKININTIDATTGEPVFQALADAELGNTFTAADVHTAFQTLMAARTPGVAPGGSDNPFWGMAQGPATGGDAMGGARHRPDAVEWDAYEQQRRGHAPVSKDGAAEQAVQQRHHAQQRLRGVADGRLLPGDQRSGAADTTRPRGQRRPGQKHPPPHVRHRGSHTDPDVHDDDQPADPGADAAGDLQPGVDQHPGDGHGFSHEPTVDGTARVDPRLRAEHGQRRDGDRPAGSDGELHPVAREWGDRH